MTTKVIVSTAFARRLKTLRKKYPNVLKDVQPLIEQLQSGETPGDRIQGLPYVVYKVRRPNRDAQRGKSGGYRIIYYVKTVTYIYLLLIYSKSDQESLPNELIVAAIEEVAGK